MAQVKGPNIFKNYVFPNIYDYYYFSLDVLNLLIYCHGCVRKEKKKKKKNVYLERTGMKEVTIK